MDDYNYNAMCMTMLYKERFEVCRYSLPSDSSDLGTMIGVASTPVLVLVAALLSPVMSRPVIAQDTVLQHLLGNLQEELVSNICHSS